MCHSSVRILLAFRTFSNSYFISGTTAGEEADPGDACHLKQGILIMSKELVEVGSLQ